MTDDDDDDDGRLYDPSQLRVLPAYDTKELETLEYPLPELGEWKRLPVGLVLRLTLRAPGAHLSLAQSSTSGSTSSSLWLSSQVLGAYLIELFKPAKRNQASRKKKTPLRALELGAGTGFLSLLLAHAGWHVEATDLPYVAHGILADNVRAHEAVTDQIEVAELDWLAEDQVDARSSAPPYDLVLSADTLYTPRLVSGLWHTFARELARGRGSEDRGGFGLVALERRDSAFIDESLAVAIREQGLELTRVDDAKLEEAVQRSLGWTKELWDGIEVWEVRRMRGSASSCHE